jgi:hypothetical protein
MWRMRKRKREEEKQQQRKFVHMNRPFIESLK